MRRRINAEETIQGVTSRRIIPAVAADSADRLLAYYSKINPELGPKYNDTLKIRDRIKPGESMDRMICARFEIPAAEAEARKRVILRIQDVDRAVSEIVEKRD